MPSATLGEEITAPLVLNFQAKVRFEGPSGAVEECAESARHIGQSFTGILSVPIAQSSLRVVYSLPEIASTAVVTLPGIRYKLPYAIATDSLGAKASIGSFQMTRPVYASKLANSEVPTSPPYCAACPVLG